MFKKNNNKNNVFKTTSEPIKNLFNSIPDLIKKEKEYL